MPRKLSHWFALAGVCILVGNLLAFAGQALQVVTQLHPTIVVALMILLGAAVSIIGFTVDWLRR